MNQACVHNGTIDAGNHHGRPQYRSFLRFLASQERNVIWLLLAIAFLPVDGTTLGLYAPFWSPISPALFAVYCLCNWRQLRIAANRYLPMFLLPVVCIILSIPGWLKFGIHLNAAFMSITGLLGVLADSRLSSIAENGAEGDGSFFARIYQSLDPICGLLAHPWTVLTGYGAGNIINAVWTGAKHAGRLLNGLGMNGSAAAGFATGMNADTVWTMCVYTSVVAEYGLVGLVLLVIASIVSMTRVFDTAAAEHGVWSKTVICWLVLIVYLYIQCENYAFAALP